MALVEEIPCRDTDPLRDEEEIDSNRDSPVAFTINFGFGEDGESAKEKAKKLERFALRSSLRKPKSPRSPGSTPAATGTPAANDQLAPPPPMTNPQPPKPPPTLNPPSKS